jgi:hypothetical protein
VAELLRSILATGTVRDLDQLQVVDDEEVESMLHLLAAGLAAEIGNGRIQ